MKCQFRNRTGNRARRCARGLEDGLLRRSAAMIVASAALAAILGVQGRSAPKDGGDRRGKIAPLIYNGEEAPVGRFPYIVSLRREADGDGDRPHKCGGMLINKHWALSAAHCVTTGPHKSTESPILYIGGHDRLDDEGSEDANIEVMRAEKTILHPQYNTRNVYEGYDIALIKLPTPSRHPAVTLASEGLQVASGSKLITIGWGAQFQSENDNDASEHLAEKLQYGVLSLITLDKCQETEEYQNMTLIEEMICALPHQGDQGENVCRGDSGGPLLLADRHDKIKHGNPAVDVALGIVSFGGRPCTDHTIAPVFTNISAPEIRRWIDFYTNGENGLSAGIVESLLCTMNPRMPMLNGVCPDPSSDVPDPPIQIKREPDPPQPTPSKVEPVPPEEEPAPPIADPPGSSPGPDDGFPLGPANEPSPVSTIPESNCTKVMNEAQCKDLRDNIGNVNDSFLQEFLEDIACCVLYRDSSGFTMLHYASRDGPTVVVQQLISLGADVNATTVNEKETPLHLAARYGQAGAVKALVDGGADTNAKDTMCQTPLYRAVSWNKGNVPEIIEILSDGGAVIDVQDGKGQTALHMAAKYGFVDSIDKLLQKGADPRIQDNSKMTPVHVASANGKVLALETLVKYDEGAEALCMTDTKSRTPEKAMCTDMDAECDQAVREELESFFQENTC